MMLPWWLLLNPVGAITGHGLFRQWLSAKATRAVSVPEPGQTKKGPEQVNNAKPGVGLLLLSQSLCPGRTDRDQVTIGQIIFLWEWLFK